MKLALFGSIAALLAACSSLTQPPEPIAADTSGAAPSAPASAASVAPKATVPAIDAGAPPAPVPEGKLVSTDLKVGTGAAAKTGDKVSVHYVGTLADGSEFDSSRKRNSPFQFTLGQGRVIKGWDQGVVGMKVGGKRKLVIPPSLGYGANGSPPRIPPNAQLTFEIELLSIDK